TLISDYRNLMADPLDKVVDEHIKFENFVSRFGKYQNLILNSVGAGEVFDKVDDMRANASLTVSALSDIYCEAMVGYSHLILHYEMRRFSFQKK
ncbi:hypothetical protein V5O48_017716, partial [Marasmius crinis-equi]